MGGNEIIDRLAQLSNSGKGGALQSIAAQKAEPDLDLIEPGSMRGYKMKMDLRMTLDPMVPFGFMGTEIVHNHMGFLIRMFRNDLVHKIQKLPAATAVVMIRFHLSRGHVQGSKQGTRPMASILMVGPGQRFAMRQLQPSLSSLQRLNRWLFVQAQDQGILRRIQVKPNNISGLARKFRIRRKTPTAS